MSLLLVLVSACKSDDKKESSSSGSSVNYVAVKADGGSNWSILDLSNGELIQKDAYELPPMISGDMMFVATPDTTGMGNGNVYTLYAIKEPTKPVTDKKFSTPGQFSDKGLALVGLNGALVIIDKKGEKKASLGDQYVSWMPFSDGMAAVINKEGKYGYVNEEGKVVVEPKYANAMPFSKDLGVVTNDDNQVIGINKEGAEQFRLPQEYTSPTAVDKAGNFIAMSGSGKAVLFNSKGEKLAELGEADGNYIPASVLLPFNGTYYFRDANGKIGLKDAKGAELVAATYDLLLPVPGSDKAFQGKKDDLYGIIGLKGDTILAFNYDDEAALKDGLTIVKQGGNVMLVDNKGEKKNKTTLQEFYSPQQELLDLINLSTLGTAAADVAEGPVEGASGLDGDYEFSGMIGGKYAFTMNLGISDGNISGSYYYGSNSGNSLSVIGRVTNAGGDTYECEFTEYDNNGNACGSWRVSIFPNSEGGMELQGSMTNFKGQNFTVAASTPTVEAVPTGESYGYDYDGYEEYD